MQKKAKSHKCDKCNSEFASVTKLNVHKKSMAYLNDEKTKCKKCEFLSCTKMTLKRHYKSTHGRGRNKKSVKLPVSENCDKCHATFDVIRGLLNHKKSPSYLENRKKQCGLCDFVSCTSDSLRNHYQLEHPGEKRKYRLAKKCDKCHAIYDVNGSLMRHKETQGYVKGDRLECQKCDSFFCTAISLNRHKKFEHKKSVSSTKIVISVQLSYVVYLASFELIF